MPDDIKPNQIEKLLHELVEMKDKLQNARVILKSYKINSDRLKELKRAKKDLGEQIEEEKRRIEDEHLENSDYETARNDELTTKNEIKEKNAELRSVMAKVNPSENLSVYDYNIKGEPLKLQIERTVKVYINGKEER